MTTTRGVDIFTLDRLAELSGRTETEIFDDVLLGRLRASIRTTATDGDDHIRREVRKRGYTDNFTVTHPRILWLTVGQVSELISRNAVTISEADYPLYVDCIEDPPVKRYKKERVIFTDSYTARLADIRFLDGDALQYIAKHTGHPLAPKKTLKELPRLGGGSYIVYRLPDETWKSAHDFLSESIRRFKERGHDAQAAAAAERARQGVIDEAETKRAAREVPAGSGPPITATAAENAEALEPGDDQAQSQPLQRGIAQEGRIISALKEKGYDPKALPKGAPGHPGVKAEIKDTLVDTSLFTSKNIFNKAWHRLRSQGEIKDQ